MKLISVRKMKTLENQANKNGLSYSQMMTNAGLGLAQVIHRRFYWQTANSVLGLVGSGNNGGDTLVALKHLNEWGWQTQAYLVKKREKDDELTTAYLDSGGALFSVSDDKDLDTLKDLIANTNCILDGILGTGIKLPLKGSIKKVLAVFANIGDLPPIVAVDCPSGVDCNSGQAAAESLPACLTVCMAAVKEGLLKQPALKLSGEITVVDIGLPDELPAWQGNEIEVVGADMAAALLPKRSDDGYKGTFGTCMLVAGSINYCGAVLLASRAAYRVGVGLVRAAIPGAIYDTLAGQMADATWLILPHTQGVINGDGTKIVAAYLKQTDCLLIGPGWGLEDETLMFLENLLDSGRISAKQSPLGFEADPEKTRVKKRVALPPMVIDADGLKLLSRVEGWEKKLPKETVLTPHPGEMAVLTGLNTKEIQANRVEIASQFAQRWGHVVVLKGALTVVADASGKTAIIPVANSALAVAGSGDVLAGMISGFIAQGLDAYSASITGAWLHAQAGLDALALLGNPASVTASDIVQRIAYVITKTGSI